MSGHTQLRAEVERVSYRNEENGWTVLRAKNQLKAGTVMTRENCGSVAEWIARHLHVYGYYRTAEVLVGEIEAVTAADMVRMAELCLGSATPTVAALGPVGSVHGANLTAKLMA